MKKVIVLLVMFCFLLGSIIAQQLYERSPFLDVYGVDVVFKEKEFVNKCDCCVDVIPKTKKCVLYKVEIKEVFLLRDTSVYQNSEEIKRVIYMVLPLRRKIENISFNTVYSILCYNSCSERLLTINQLLLERPDPLPQYKGLVYIGGLVKCKDFTVFQKIFLLLGINREKIYKQAKDLPIDRSKFIQAIEANN